LTPKRPASSNSARRSPHVISEDGVDYYAVAMQDLEGNEFDIN